MSIESIMPYNHLILRGPLLLFCSIFPSIGVFSNELALHIRWPKYWSFSFSVSSPKNIQDWFPSGLTDWISLQSKGLSRVFSNTTIQKHKFSSCVLLYGATRTSIWKNHSFDCMENLFLFKEVGLKGPTKAIYSLECISSLILLIFAVHSLKPHSPSSYHVPHLGKRWSKSSCSFLQDGRWFKWWEPLPVQGQPHPSSIP